MLITKYVHSCLLVEADDKTAIFDPGAMSEEALSRADITSLDHIFITHIHQDHMHIPLVKDLVDKFPDVKITSTKEVVERLADEGVTASTEAPEGVSFFDSPHENVEPLFPIPQEIGINYLGVLSDPGDSHSFKQTKDILALPITAPWGAAIKALNLAIELKPKYIIPIHDWHWSDAARQQMYDGFESVLSKEGITFYKPETGVTIDIQANII